jgi:hypothetical protein
MSTNFEKQLLEICFIVDKTFYELHSDNTPNPFRVENAAGIKWLLFVFKRHPELPFRKPQPLSLARTRCLTPEMLEISFVCQNLNSTA